MKKLGLILSSLLLLTSCASQQPLSIYVVNNNSITVNGWQATLADVPNIVDQYRPSSVVIHGNQSGENFADAIKVRNALTAAGVKDVTVAGAE